MPRGRDVLPPEIAQHNSHVFNRFRVAPIWRPEALRGYRSRIRMTAAGSLMLRASVRIDEHADGRVSGHLVLVDLSRRGEAEEREVRQFRVGRRDLAELRSLIAQSRLWQIHPQYWGYADPENWVCVDGMEFVFERLDAQGYRFSTSNAQCTMPDDIRSVAAKVIGMAGEPRLARMLR